ncbi:MAG: glucose 1-dehydrogenase [Elusimicrobia bacterium]|nr:glucose 1-dehydrogenase [Elusimicrobiota bacterium]
MRLDGKISLITGAGSGIGQAIAKRFAVEGARVVVVDINEAGGIKTVDMIKKAGGEAVFIKANITILEQAQSMVTETVQRFGKLDCAVNNAGVEAKLGDMIETTQEQDFDRVIGINVKGTWLCMKFELIQMHKQGCGSIVNVASVLGTIGVPGFSSYVASKHAIVGLTKCAALENATKGIRVNALCPAAVQTPMLDRAEGVDWSATQPMGRTGNVDEAASGALWLCSDESSFTSGHTLLLDGCWAAG